MPALISSQSLLMLSLGVSAYLALIHLWLAPSGHESNRWVAAWALLSIGFGLARFLQLDTLDPELAVAAARAYTAMSPLLIFSLVRFVRSLSGRPTTPAGLRLSAGATLAFAAAIQLTPWFVTARIVPSLDLFGRPYLGVRGGPAAPAIGVQIALAVAWVAVLLWRSDRVSPRERWVLFACISLYAAMGASTVASSLEWVPFAGTAEYGALAVAVGTNQLLVSRQRRLEAELERQVDERAAGLRESEERYRAIAESAPIGILACDADGLVLATNPRLRELLGAPDRGFDGERNLLNDEGSIASGFADLLRQALAGGRLASGEVRFESSWGRSLDLRFVVSPQRDPSGRVTGALVLSEDASERNELERRLQKSQKIEALGQLAAGIAHEINNPMAYVRANFGTLREECAALRAGLEPDGPAARRLAEIERRIEGSLQGVQRAIQIVAEMRQLARGR